MTVYSFAQSAPVKHATPRIEWRRVSSFKFDWDGHGETSIVMEIPVGWKNPGDFTRISLNMPGQKPLMLTNKNGWVKRQPDDISYPPELWKTNLVRSDYVLAAKVASGRTLLFFFGNFSASGPDSLDVIEVSASGQPRVVLHRNALGVKEIRDLDGDGVAEIVGFPCLSQMMGPDISTYDPYNVFKLAAAPGDSASLSLSLSEGYNREHYYGWAGAQCSEKIAVVLHPANRGKPKIMAAEKAMREYDRNAKVKTPKP